MKHLYPWQRTPSKEQQCNKLYPFTAGVQKDTEFMPKLNSPDYQSKNGSNSPDIKQKLKLSNSPMLLSYQLSKKSLDKHKKAKL